MFPSQLFLRHTTSVVLLLSVMSLLLHAEISLSDVFRYRVPYFLANDHPILHSIVRITWGHWIIPCDDPKPSFSISAYDDTGMLRGTINLPWQDGPGGCGKIVEFNSHDLENGNADIGMTGIGPGEGDWQLIIESQFPTHVSSYFSTEDHFLIPMHDVVPPGNYYADSDYHITTFYVGDAKHESYLRIINPNDYPVLFKIRSQDDVLVGAMDSSHWIHLEAHEVITITATDLETYNPAWENRSQGYQGMLNDPGYPVDRLRIYFKVWDATTNSQYNDSHINQLHPLIVMNLMEDSETGLIANLSTLPEMAVRANDEVDTTESDISDTPDDETASFNIAFQFSDEVPQSVQDSLNRAATKWESIIIGDLPAYDLAIARGSCNGSAGYEGQVDDLLVFVSFRYLGGLSAAVGRADVCVSSNRGSGGSLLPVASWITVNKDATSDWSVMTPLFDAIMKHELGHALGFAPQILQASGYMRYAPSNHFAGPLAVQAFNSQGGSGYDGNSVPMKGDSDHWDDNVMGGEIMASGIAKQSVISIITVQTFADLGYEVDTTAAEHFYLYLPGSLNDPRARR